MGKVLSLIIMFSKISLRNKHEPDLLTLIAHKEQVQSNLEPRLTFKDPLHWSVCKII